MVYTIKINRKRRLFDRTSVIVKRISDKSYVKHPADQKQTHVETNVYFKRINTGLQLQEPSRCPIQAQTNHALSRIYTFIQFI